MLNMEEFNVQVPKYRESMRRSHTYDFKYWWHGCDEYDSLKGIVRTILNKSIGKPFGKVYSDFLKRYGNIKAYNLTAREIFLEKFNQDRDWYGNFRGGFYVDENYNIQKYKVKEKPKRLTPVKYKWNIEKYPITDEIYNTFKIFFGNSAYDVLYLTHEAEITRNIIIAFENAYYKNTKTKCSEWLHSNISKCFIPCEYKELERMSYKDRKIYTAEYKRIKKKNRKKWKKEQQLKNEEYLRTYNRLQKEKEKLENSLTIERLGFDEETSFRGIEYHGQKRKLK